MQDSISNGSREEISDSLRAYQADIARFSKQIDLSGQQLLSLINGILDLAAIEEGTLDLKCESLYLRSICENVVQQLQPMATKKGLLILLEGDDVEAYADPLRITQILFNLIGNAVKFTARGEITVRLGQTDCTAWVEVEDTGEGLDEEDIPKIFDRFAQLDSSHSRENGGVGLGLPISRELAELHGGSVHVRSRKGQGSVFRLELVSLRAADHVAA